MSRLERWSRLKRGETPAASSVAAPPEPDEDELPTAEADGETVAPEPEPGSLDHTLPDPDTLPPGSDIKAYLVSGVSAGLRKRALRRLFAASHYGVRDGLDDYDDDFRAKLQPLAEDVAARLREWTRQAPDESTADAEPAADGDPASAAEPLEARERESRGDDEPEEPPAPSRRAPPADDDETGPPARGPGRREPGGA